MTHRYDATEIADLKARVALSDLFKQYGIASRGNRKARWAKCCFHGEKSPSLKINDDAGSYHCFGCGASGDHFDALAYLGGKSFGEAVEVLGGVRLITKEERDEIEKRRREQEAAERREAQKTRSRVEKLFDDAIPIAGTHAAAYLEARGLPVVPGWTFDLRFFPALPYKGFVDAKAEDATELGSFPAMVAAIRNAAGAIIGLHRTWLDPAAPKKLTPPGDVSRNKAKKVLGEQKGGMIRLSRDIGAVLALGEGIETTRAWFAMGFAGDRDVSIAAAISLGNLSGGAAGSVEHPRDSSRRIPNGMPDYDRPGIILPAEVREVILLGDGDSDPEMTRARLLVAGRRFRAAGIAPFVQMAPDGKDFADLAVEGDVAA